MMMKIDDALVQREADFDEAIKDLHEARKIIKALLGAPPPRVWKKWPNVHKQAKDFVKKLDADLA